MDLDDLRWQRGGYDLRQLEARYTGNDVRAQLVVDKVHDLVTEPQRMRGLGFCVSVAHARFMAAYFTRCGLPAVALTSDSPPDERRTAQRRLARREIRCIFTVDLYNEGVDIPEVDTVLLLRPTESLTVYLQQLGRGLRLHDEKECLTVLDFIGAQHRRFRFAARLRALSTEPTARVDREVEQGFPHLPAGCALRLERVAQQRVLENIRQSLNLRRPQIVRDLAELGRHLGRAPSLREALDYLHTDLDELLKRGLWSRLLAEAELAEPPTDPDEAVLARGIRRLAHVDDPRQIRFLLRWLEGEQVAEPDPALHERRRTMLLLSLLGSACDVSTLAEAESRLRQNPAACADLRTLLTHRLHASRTRMEQVYPALSGPLALHASYTRDEILAGLRYWTLAHRPRMSEGVLHLPEPRVDAFFITLHKSDAAYSPTTMYEDYAISDRLFHWQSQSTTSVESPTGRRYIHHREQGYTPLLFVREHQRLPAGLAAPYHYLGPAEHVSHEGSRPISIVWQLTHPMPARLLRETARQRSA